MDYTKLCELAKKATMNSYVPYSGYRVGAALLTKTNKVYLGCNIENASYSPTVCAERTAIFKAVSEGEREFAAIAVAGGKDGVIKETFPPCGVCRQVMQEFCDPETFVVIFVGPDGYEEHYLKELLPFGFDNSKMKDGIGE